MTARKLVIENFCRVYLDGKCKEVEAMREIYKHSVTTLVSGIDVTGDVERAIQYVGQELFDPKPVKLIYVLMFLEFVIQIYLKTDGEISHVDILRLTTDIIEKTDFSPAQHQPGLFSIILTACFKIFSFVTDVFY